MTHRSASPDRSLLAALFEGLRAYRPALAGTYPPGLPVEGSDLDVVCEADDLDRFERDLNAILEGAGHAPSAIERLPLDPEALVARLPGDGIPIEVFCQRRPVIAQHAFRHMVIEGRLLVARGPALREAILARKRAGQKTEPAFAEELALDGDPYAALLDLETWSPERIDRLIAARGKGTQRPRHDALFVVTLHTGDRSSLWPLFRLADDSEAQIRSYIDEGAVLVARPAPAPGAHAGRNPAHTAEPIVGHLLLIDTGEPGTLEIKSMAVDPAHRSSGIGRLLVGAAVDHARASGAARLTVSTGAAGVGNLRFYQRVGFRMARIERDAFTPSTGYPDEILIDGVPLRDRVWLDRDL